jgi:ornithine cyclodeaminase
VFAVDTRELAAKVGDLVGPISRGVVREADMAEIGEILLGTRPGRTNADQITLFKSVGHAANDVAIARFLVQQAGEQGRGTRVELP